MAKFGTMKRLLLLLVPVALLLFLYCRPTNAYTSKPSKSNPGEENELPEVNLTAFHDNDSVTSVYVEISNEQLLYKRPDTSHVFYTHLKVSYQLTAEQSKKVLDSSSYNVLDRAEGENVPVRSLYSFFRVPAVRGALYLLELEVFDLNRRIRYHKLLPLNKQSRLGPQNFLVRRNDTVAFRNHFLKDQQVSVTYTDPMLGAVMVESFTKEYGPALPPFSVKEPDELKYKPDSVFILRKDGGIFGIAMPAKGFYHVKAEANEKEGLTLFTYDEHFPGVGNSGEMISCARYIMSREEFESCQDAPDKKAAIDKFWLGIGGSNERARELLKRYYGRVKEANKHYTSYTQGWKTDRGMVFIVFGQPANIYKSRKDEIWVYGNEANPAALRFVFNKTKNPYSENDYVLERSQFYKDPWYGAVDYWRQGHVYFDGRR
jgi:GWxTD domain-containing protein